MTIKKKTDNEKPPEQKSAEKMVTLNIETCSAFRIIEGLEFKFHSPYATRLEADRIAKQLKENGLISAYRILKRITIYCLYIHQ